MRLSGKRLFTLVCSRPRICGIRTDWKLGPGFFAGPFFRIFLVCDGGAFLQGVLGESGVFVMVFCGEVVGI